MNSIKIALATIGLVGALGAAQDASAVLKDRNHVQLAPSICGPLDPNKDAVLRRNLNGLRNNDVVNVSVSCTLEGDEKSTGLTYVYVYFRNTASVNRTIICSLVTGIPYYGQSTFAKSFVLTPGQQSFLGWIPTTDFPVGTKYANLQCALAPGVVMSEVAHYDQEDVGA